MSINNQEKDFYQEMGFRLKQVRQERNVSQQALAQSLGVVTQTIQKYESGEIRMLPEIIHHCALIFKVSVAYFYGEETIKISSGKATVLLASEISKLPSNDIKNSLYHLVRSINKIVR